MCLQDIHIVMHPPPSVLGYQCCGIICGGRGSDKIGEFFHLSHHANRVSICEDGLVHHLLVVHCLYDFKIQFSHLSCTLI